MFDHVYFSQITESDFQDGSLTLEAAALAAYTAAIQCNAADSCYDASKNERKFADFMNLYARTYIRVHGYAKPETELKPEDFGRDEDPLAGWDEIPADSSRFNLPDSGSKGPRLSAAEVRKLVEAEKLACVAARAEDEDDEDEGFRW